MIDFLKSSENIVFLILNKDGDILFYNRGFKKLFNIQNEKVKKLEDYFINKEEFKSVDFSQLKELLKDKLLLFPYIDNTLTINAKIYEEDSNFIFLGEIRNHTDLKVVEKMSRLTSELTSLTRDLHRKNQEIKEKDKLLISQSRLVAMSEMTTMIAHHWRQPLAIIAMALNNILMDIELGSLNEESVKNDSHDILDQTSYLSKIIDEFSGFIRSNKEKEFFSVNDVLIDSLSMLSKSLEINNIEIILDIQDNTKINIYSKELLQVFLSIITNASEALLKNRQKNRYIKIGIIKENETIITKFSNNGGNIESENLIKIFEPYFSTKYEKNNIGLGLYVSKLILQKDMNGSIKVKNIQDGVCFSVEIAV